MTARFAISIPIGAWHPLLGDCLASLTAQGDRVEIAALDASGDDRVASVLDQFSDRIAYRRNGPDDGQSDAIIEGWRNTRAPYLGWLNADDALYPGALASVAEKLESEPALDLVYGDSTIIDDTGAYRGYHWAVQPPGEEILSGCTISQPSCFFSRDAVNQVGGLNADLHFTMDWDLWVRLWRAGARFGFIEQTLSRVLWSEEAKTGGFNAQRRAELERIIGAGENPVVKLKSRIGFALHHVLEYRAPAPVARTFRKRNAARARIINGFDKAGGLRGPALLPMVCWSNDKPSSIELKFAPNGAGGVTVQGRRTTYSDGFCRAPLTHPPTLGETVDVAIDPDRATDFISARWG